MGTAAAAMALMTEKFPGQQNSAARSSSLHSLANTSAPLIPFPSNDPALGSSPNVPATSLGIRMDGIDAVAANSLPCLAIAAAAAPAPIGARKFLRDGIFLSNLVLSFMLIFPVGAASSIPATSCECSLQDATDLLPVGSAI